MKIIPTTYTFNASAKTIVCNDFSVIEKLAIITNLTTGVIIYQFNSPTKGGTLSGKVLTLDFDTTTMSNGDDLQIIIHDTEKQQIGDSFILRSLLSSLKRLVVDAAGQLRAVVSGTVAISSGTITTVTTTGTANISMGNLGKAPTTIAFLNGNFQGGGRRLLRKI